MNEHAKIKIPSAPTSVTTGAIGGSHKVYAAPKEHPDLRAPFRQIELSDPLEPPVRVYDASGPYTDADPRIDLAAGLAPVRESWIAGRGYSTNSRPRGEAGGQRPRRVGPARAALPGEPRPPRRLPRPTRHPI